MRVMSFDVSQENFDSFVESVYYKMGCEMLDIIPIEFPDFIVHEIIAVWPSISYKRLVCSIVVKKPS